MAVVSGPQLDALVEQLASWYVKTREELIEALETPYPYGSKPLSPAEQVDRFMSMTQEDWDVLATRLAEKYRGRPDMLDVVRQEIQAYITHMAKLAYRR